MVQGVMGWHAFPHLYLISGVVGGLVSLLLGREPSAMGSSGVISGLFAASIVGKLYNGEILDALSLLCEVVGYVAVNYKTGLYPYITFGGFGGGVGCSLIMMMIGRKAFTSFSTLSIRMG